MSKVHKYGLEMRWTGNKGSGTFDYRAYDRSFEITASKKSKILGSSDPAFRGDETRYNPEEMLLASVSSCHMLWYLHLCADSGVIVVSYIDSPIGFMEEFSDGRGRFTKIILNLKIQVTEEDMIEKAKSLHKKAGEMCFIANSVNFEIDYEYDISVG